MTTDKAFATYLLNLEDESFFAVYRNYLGPVKTPYNKHDLMQELQDFLVRPTTGDRIRELLTHRDVILLSAIAVLGTPTEEQLYRFLSGEFEYSTFQATLLNHTDRLLIIDGPHPASVRLNPLLEPALSPLELGVHHLVIGAPLERETGEDAPSPPWLTPVFLAAMYAFLREHQELFTRNGTLRKRTATELNDRFGVDSSEGAGFLRFVLTTCETLGLLTRAEEGDTITLRPESWEAFAEIPERWIRVLLWAAPLTSTVERTYEYAELLFQAIGSIPADRSFSLGEIVRLLQLSGNGLSLPIDRDTVDRLTRVGVFRQISTSDETALEDSPTRYALNPLLLPTVDTPPTTGSVRVQANMEIGIPPGAPFTEAFTVARMTRLHRFDTVPTFTLTEDSVADARRDGLADPLAALADVTADLPQNVRFLLKRWETRSRAVRMMQGLVVTAEEEEAAILRNSEEFTRLLREELAPGVFLLPAEEDRAVEKLLNRMDIGATPTVETAVPVDIDVPEYDRYLLRYQQPALRPTPAVAFSGTVEPAGGADGTAAQTRRTDQASGT